MSNSDFEKQVKQRMDDLQFVPSEPVWQQVEKIINKRKKRRFVFLWLFLLFLGAGGSFIWLEQTGSKKEAGLGGMQQKTTDAGSINSSLTKNNNPIQQSTTANNKSVITDKNTGKTTHTDLLSGTTKDGRGQENSSVANLSGKQRTPTNRQLHSLESAHAGSKNIHGSGRPNKKQAAVADITVTSGNSSMEEKNNENKTAEDSRDDARVPGIIADTNKVVVANIPTVGKAKNTNADKKQSKDSLLEKLQQATGKKRSKWEWGISGRVGMSTISSGFKGLLFGNTEYNSGLMYAPSTGNYTAAFPYSNKPSPIRPGIAYAVGFSLRKVYKNFNLLTGINYNVFSTRMTVGTRVDSANLISQGTSLFANVNGYYRNSYIGLPGNNYTNYFHLLEIPVALEKRLGNKSPFSVSAGLSIAALLSSTALHYDAQNNIYFKDNGLINTTQLGFTAGLHYKLIDSRQLLIQLGPEFNYSLTNVYKRNWYSSNHLFNASLGLRMYLKK
jgi:hypothetical protein